MDNRFVILVTLQDIQYQLWEHVLLKLLEYLFKSNFFVSIHLKSLVGINLDIA